MAKGRWVCGLPMAVLVCGCVSGNPSIQVESTRELGPLQFLGAIRGRDGGYSAGFRGRSVWVFGDTVLEWEAQDGARWRSSTWCWTRDLNAADSLADLSEPVDEKGAPGEFLPFTTDEAEFNRLHFRNDLPDDQFARWALWPGPVAVDPKSGEALVFYSKLLCRRGEWSFTPIGYSLALWTHPDRTPVRPVVRAGDAEPTLLFPKNDVVLGQAALVVEDRLYAYGVRSQGLSWPCILGRVRFSQALHRDAWEFYSGSSGWVKDWKRGQEIMQAAPMLSVHWNPYLRSYLATYSDPLQNTISMRTATEPEGPWSPAIRVFEGMAPPDKRRWNYCGMAHGELAREKGKIEYLHYHRETGFLMGEIRLVELRFK